jgi:hypothetical protein
MNKMTTALLMLLLGAVVYYLFRPSIILFDLINMPSLKIFSQNNTDNSLCRFCSNHLSDIFWSLFINFSALWMDEKKLPPVYRNIILSIPFIYELGLLLHINRGTFDLVDLLFYLIIFITVYNPLKQKKYAEN